MIIERQIQRIAELLGTPTYRMQDYGKIRIEGVLCCQKCFPRGWQHFSTYIADWGSLDKNEPIRIGDEKKLLFEHHETGPEITAYLASGSASLTMVAAIINLIITLIEATKKDPTDKGEIIVSIIRYSKEPMPLHESVLEEITLDRDDLDKTRAELDRKLKKGFNVRRWQLPTYIIKDPRKRAILFSLQVHGAQSVKVAGTFNDWQETDLKQLGNDLWAITVEVPEGIYLYKYLIDDNVWKLDPKNPDVEYEEDGTSNSVFLVE